MNKSLNFMDACQNYLPLLALLVLPLLILINFTDPFVFPKSLFLMILGALLFINLGIRGFFREYLIALMPLIFFVYSPFLSEYQISGLLFRIFSLSSFLILWFLSYENSKKKGIYFLSVSFVVILFIGICQFLGYKWGLFEELAGKYKVFSLLGNPNHFGGFCAVCFYSFLIYKKYFNKLILWILLLMSIIGLICSFSFGAWISFSFGFLCLEIKNKKRILFVIVILISLFLLSRFNSESLKKNIIGKLNLRNYIYYNTLIICKNNVFFGTGLGTFGSEFSLWSGEFNFNRYKLNNDFSPSLRNRYYYAHCEILQWFMETGIFGIIFFCISGYFIVINNIKIKWNPVYTVVFFHSLLSPVMHQPGIMCVLFLFPPIIEKKKFCKGFFKFLFMLTGILILLFVLFEGYKNYYGTLIWNSVKAKQNISEEKLNKNYLLTDIPYSDPWIKELFLSLDILKGRKNYADEIIDLIKKRYFSGNLLKIGGYIFFKEEKPELLFDYLVKGMCSLRLDEATFIFQCLINKLVVDKKDDLINRFVSELSLIKENKPVLYRSVSRAYALNKNLLKAIFWEKKYFSININDHNSLYNIGCYYMDLFNYIDAEKTFKRCVRLKNDFAPAYLNLGILYVSKKHYEKAIKCFNKVKELSIRESDLYRAGDKNLEHIKSLMEDN